MNTILFAADYVYLGGGEIALLDLIGALKKMNFKAVLVIPETGPLFCEAKARCIDVRIVNMPVVDKRLIIHPFRFLSSILKLMRIVKDEGIKYIFSNNLNAGIYASLAGKFFGARSIWYCWASHFSKNKSWQLAYMALFDKVVFCSHFVENEMRLKLFKQNRLSVSYPGIDLSKFESGNMHLKTSFKIENRIPDDYDIFSIVGRIDPCKNHFMFLDMAGEVVKWHPNSYFVIAGAYTEREGGDLGLKLKLDEKIRKTPSLAGKVLFTGFIRDIQKIIKSSAIIFSCSGNSVMGESFGLTIAESMISGVPVIATSIGGPLEIIKDGFNGFLVEPDDYKAMAEKALTLLRSPSERGRIVENAERYAVEKYRVERFARHIIDAYSSPESIEGGIQA